MSNEQNDRSQNPLNDRLTSLLGFDPGKHFRLTSDAFQEVVKELNEERTVVAKGKAKELLSKAIDLRQKLVQAEREFFGATKKFNKELGKVIGAINGILSGQPPKAEGDDTDDADKD